MASLIKSERGQVYALFAIVVFTCAFGSLTQTVMNAMLGGVEADLGIDASLGQWLTTVYMLVLGITVPLVTFLSLKISTRNLLFMVLGIFFAGSLLAFVAPNFPVLVLARVLQAFAAGITLPLIQSIAMMRFPKGQNGTAMGISGIAMGFAPNIGPTIGGALVDSWGWRSFFLILMAALAVLFVLSLLFVEHEGVPEREAALDVPSFLLSTCGLGGLLLGFSNASSIELTNPAVWAFLLVGVVCLIAFVLRQNRVRIPLINMAIFRSKRYRASFVIQNCLFGSFMGITLIVPLYVQGLCGGSALEAGLVFIPATILAIVFNPLAGILADKIGPRPVTVVAGALLAIGGVSMAFIDATTPLWLVTLMQTIRGIGVSSLIGPLNSWGMSELPHQIMMDGSAFFACIRQACASFGTALMVFAITALGVAATGEPAALGYQIAFALSALLSIAVFIGAVWKVRS